MDIEGKSRVNPLATAAQDADTAIYHFRHWEQRYHETPLSGRGVVILYPSKLEASLLNQTTRRNTHTRL
jgi:hypothetical protein